MAGAPAAGDGEPAQERDFAAELDDRIRLRQLFEGLRGRLARASVQAAALCYLQGLSRAEAAARMGISEARMRKLMEGPGPGRPGVAGKVGELVETIRGGGWCEEQGSLMRGLAFGILDPAGERYRLALAHQQRVPGLPRLRRLAARPRRGAAAGAPARGARRRALARVGGRRARRGGCRRRLRGGHAARERCAAAGAGAQAGPGIGGACRPRRAPRGVGGAAGGGWLLAGGGIGAKLAVGCLLALGVGAGCVALDGDRSRAARPRIGSSALTSPCRAGAAQREPRRPTQ